MSKYLKINILSLILAYICINLSTPAEGVKNNRCREEKYRVRDGIKKIYVGDIKKGVEIIEKGIQSCTSDYLYNYNLAIAYGYLEKYDKMARYLTNSLKIKPDFRPTLLNHGWVLIKKRDYSKGLALIKKAEEIKKSSGTRLIMAFSSLTQGNIDDFNKFREEAVTLGLKEKEKYFELIKTIKKESKKNVYRMNRLPYLALDSGRLYEKIGDFDTAEKYYRESNTLNSTLRLVSLLEGLGKKVDRKKYFEEWLDWNYELLPEVAEALKYKKYYTYPEGVLTFIYPEDLVKIPEGKVAIGLPGKTKSDKNDFWKHDVYTSKFLIGKYEVSNIEYLTYLDSTGYPSPLNTHNSDYDLWRGGKFRKKLAMQPVVNVSWFDAVNYVKWKSYISGFNYRLPSEERWEKAARGEDGRLYPWGNSSPSRKTANFGKNWDADKYTFLVDVDSYPAGKSPYGIFNMAGNAWEWCSTTYISFFYDDTDYRPADDIVRKAEELKVFRGGSWINKPKEIRATFRNRSWPQVRYNGIGFRVTREVEK